MDPVQEIRIRAVAETREAAEEIQVLAKAMTKLKEASNGMPTSFTFNMNHKFANPLKVISKEADKAKEAMSAVGEKVSAVGQAIASGNVEIEKSADAASDLNEQVSGSKDALGKIGDIKDKNPLKPIKESAETAKKSVNGMKEEVKKAGSTVKKTGDAANETAKSVKKMGDATSKAGKDAKDAEEEISPFKKTMLGIKSAFQKAIAPISQFFSSIKRIAMYRLIRSVIKQITQGFMDAYRAMYKWSQAGNDNNKFANSMDKIATSLHYIHASLAALSAPLVNALAPVLDNIGDKFVWLLNVINQILATVTNQSGWTKAIKKQITYGETLGETNKQAKELKKTLLGIDEINLLNGATDTGTTESNDLYDFEWVKWEKDNAIHNFFKDWELDDVVRLIGEVIIGLKTIKALCAGNFTIAGLTLSLGGLWDEIDNIKDVLSDKQTWKNVAREIVDSGAITAGFALIGSAIGKATEFGAVGAIVSAAGNLFANISDQFKNGIDWDNTFGTIAWSNVAAIAMAILMHINPLLGALVGTIVATVEIAFTFCKNNWGFVTDFFKLMVNDFVGFLETIVNAFIHNFLDPIINGIDAFLKFVSNGQGGIDGWKGTLGNVTIPKFTDMTEGVVDWDTWWSKFFVGGGVLPGPSYEDVGKGATQDIVDKFKKDTGLDSNYFTNQMSAQWEADLIAKLNAAIAEAAVNKGTGDVYLDGDKVGKVMEKRQATVRKSNYLADDFMTY